MIIIDNEIGKQRLKICGSCDKLKETNWGIECSVCNCKLKLKAPIKSSKCPLGKWENIESEIVAEKIPIAIVASAFFFNIRSPQFFVRGLGASL